jgi:predicted Zn-dependent protease
VGIDLSGITYQCGSGLTDDDARRVVNELRERLALSEFPSEISRTDSTPGYAVSRRVAGWVGTLGMLFVFVTGIAWPARAVMLDLPTCTGDLFKPSYRPLDLRALPREGRVYLVPFDDFPSHNALWLAEYYRTKYDIPVEVRQPMKLPASAYDTDRGQFNSSRMLARLDEQYPKGSERIVVVGLTGHDMYSPDLSWRYTFSTRSDDDRLAVVSAARMDYGCLGFSSTSPPQQLTRLRKVVGKDLGVLYFRLAQSEDPGSMLYSDIGGVQELDRMTEDF